jgi:hypothetical protein
MQALINAGPVVTLRSGPLYKERSDDDQDAQGGDDRGGDFERNDVIPGIELVDRTRKLEFTIGFGQPPRLHANPARATNRI